MNRLREWVKRLIHFAVASMNVRDHLFDIKRPKDHSVTASRKVCELVRKIAQNTVMHVKQRLRVHLHRLHVCHELSNWVSMYQTRKHIILWAIIHSLLIDPKECNSNAMGKKCAWELVACEHREKNLNIRKWHTHTQHNKKKTNKC